MRKGKHKRVPANGCCAKMTQLGLKYGFSGSNQVEEEKKISCLIFLCMKAMIPGSHGRKKLTL
jgi:hypothetical protein